MGGCGVVGGSYQVGRGKTEPSFLLQNIPAPGETCPLAPHQEDSFCRHPYRRRKAAWCRKTVNEKGWVWENVNQTKKVKKERDEEKQTDGLTIKPMRRNNTKMYAGRRTSGLVDG